VTSSITDEEALCHLCHKQSLCGGLGVIRYAVPMEDARFGKLFRCPNHPTEQDAEHQDRLRRVGNLSAFVDRNFENFQTNLSMHTSDEQASLNLALSTARRFADNAEGWLLLEGTYGCGKTHLAAAVGNARLAKGDFVLFITTPDLLDHLRSAYGPSSEMGYDETFDRIRSADVLILDDLGVENPSPWAQEKLFQLLNHRYSHEMPTVITTNVDVDLLDPRIRSRLLDVNLIRRVKIAAPDYRSLAQNQRTQLQSNLVLYNGMTFDTFDFYNDVTGEERQNLETVVRAAYQYAEEPQGWFILLGKYGTGKTHLAAAIANYWQERVKPDALMFITAPDLLDHLRFTYSPNAPVSFDQRFQAVRNVPYLVLDDLGTENATSWAREKLFQILDYRYLTQLPTVITSVKELDGFDERILTRILDDRISKIWSITARNYVIRRRRK
jgi:DNA replication protein DnaC